MIEPLPWNMELIESGDGSHTLYVPLLKETYHSTHGAIVESRYVYIKQGLEILAAPSLKVLEVGFGTGLNALLSLIHATKNNQSIEYHTIEPFPINQELVHHLNYGTILGMHPEWMQMHQTPFNESTTINNSFIFHKSNSTIQDYQCNTLFDIIYYDAFAPSKQAEMWEESIFEKLFNTLNQGGIIVSYCASGAFKRNLRKSGFVVETLAGPPGKKEMTRGMKELKPQ
jgi:tRNA U34 5-methylaminomethyl-2-thiouridine-forming methyltransferase MnmC